MPAVVAGHAAELARLVGDQVQLRAHAGHRIDLATQLRDEEGVHRRVGGPGTRTPTSSRWRSRPRAAVRQPRPAACTGPVRGWTARRSPPTPR
ncbi:hypothetical protein G6F60_015012 [Rhizopus arrhizus]|nr:hypothetical protein G6F60_015012 [Rhizopus arrhizus]